MLLDIINGILFKRQMQNRDMLKLSSGHRGRLAALESLKK